MRPGAKGVCCVSVPIAFDLEPGLRLVPIDHAVIGACAQNAECLECPGRYSDFFEGLDGKEIFEVDRLVALVVLHLEIALPRLPDRQRPSVEGLVRMVRLDWLAVACGHTDNAPLAVEIILGRAAQGLDSPSIPFDFSEVFEGGLWRAGPQRAREDELDGRRGASWRPYRTFCFECVGLGMNGDGRDDDRDRQEQ